MLTLTTHRPVLEIPTGRSAKGLGSQGCGCLIRTPKEVPRLEVQTRKCSHQRSRMEPRNERPREVVARLSPKRKIVRNDAPRSRVSWRKASPVRCWRMQSENTTARRVRFSRTRRNCLPPGEHETPSDRNDRQVKKEAETIRLGSGTVRPRCQTLSPQSSVQVPLTNMFKRSSSLPALPKRTHAIEPFFLDGSGSAP
jgi:hypothetical protein